MPNATSGQVGQYRLHWILIQPFFIPNNTLTQFYHLQDHKTKKKKKDKKRRGTQGTLSSYLMACSLWALRTSGFWFLLAMISAREAPVMALVNFTARRVRFFATSSCYKKKNTIHWFT